MLLLKKIFGLLDVKQRPQAIILLCLMSIGMLLETLSIGVVIPVLAMISEPDILDRYPGIVSAVPGLDDASQIQLIIGCMLLMVGIYTIKNCFLAFLTWRQADFAFGVMTSLSQNLFNGYMYQPYNFHLKRNSAELIRNISSEVQYFSNSIIAITSIAAELLVLLGIVVLLVVVEPFGAIFVIVAIALVSAIFYQVNRKRVLRWGEIRQAHEMYRLQHLQQGLGSVKEIKLLGREGDFLNQYALHTLGSARMSKRQNVLQAMPRLLIEWLAILGMAVLVFSLLAQDRSMQELVPTLGLFAAAAFRLMPSVNRILSHIQSIRFTVPVVDNLDRELNIIKSLEVLSQEETLPAWKEIALKGIAYTYSDAPHPALTDVNLTIPKGSSVGFIGESGAGKSTLVDVIIGLLSPSKGRIVLDDYEINENLRAWQNQLGYVPQQIYLTDDTLRRNIAFGLAEDQIDDLAVQRAIDSAQIHDFVQKLPEGVNTQVGERGVRLSGGQLQRIGIARALYHNPAILVLDEATSALDIDTEHEIMKTINKLHGDKTLIIVAHRISTVENCDCVYRLEQGQVIQEGTPSQVLNRLGSRG